MSYQDVGVYGTVETLKSYAKVEPRPESISVPEGYGRVLAEDVASSADLPAQDIACVEGFAVRCEDAAVAAQRYPIRLRIKKRRQPDRLPRRILKRETCSIMASDCLPLGADTVLPKENVEAGVQFIVVKKPVKRGDFVNRAGTEIKKGSKILSKGAVLRTQEIVLLSDCQVNRIVVFSRPRVAILQTEFRQTDKKPGGATDKTARTVTGVVATLVKETGGTAFIVETVPHSSQAAADALAAALKDSEIAVMVTRSSGEQPHPIQTAISSLGKPGLVVHGVRIEHGGFMGFGAVDGKPIIVMPDAVQGAMNAFVILLYPLIRNLLGRSFEGPPQVLATLNTDWEIDSRFLKFTKVVYVSLWTGPDGLVAEPILQDVEDSSFLIKVNAYLIVPEALMSLKRGTKVWPHLLPGFSYVGARFL